MKMNKKVTYNKNKVIFSAVVFILCAGLVFAYVNKVFSMGDSDSNRQTFQAFYAEERNTIDMVYLGTSASNRYFINPMAYNDEGISSFTMATMGMPMFFIPNLIEEIEKTQDPKLYVIELRWAIKERDQITDAHIRRVTDNMKLSQNKKNAVDKAFEYMDGSKGGLNDIGKNGIEYYIPVIKYHGKLTQKTMVPGDFSLIAAKNETKGFVISPSTVKQVNQFESRLTEGYEPLSEIVDDALNEVLDYCDTIDKDILFVLAPYSVKKSHMPVYNTAMKMVTERGYNVINFNTSEMYGELGIDWDKDFYNSKHVNYLGAEKYTSWLTKHIKERYGLKDHRGDSRYDSWAEAYETYRAYVKDGIKTIGHKDELGGEVTMIYDRNIDIERSTD